VGITPRSPGARYNVDVLMDHIDGKTALTPCISLSRSYGVAEDYARNASRKVPTRADPAYVYEIEVSDFPPPRPDVVDPVQEIANALPPPLASHSYHHDGDQTFLLGVVDPANGFAGRPIRYPSLIGYAPTPRPPVLSRELQSLVRALRDAEIVVIGNLPATCIINRFDVY
jgi:hypothetical protein